jgi:hypothetical protein
MSRETARIVLRREVTAAAAAARDEDTFFAGLAARGIQVRFRYDPARPGRITGYSAGLGRSYGAGSPAPFAGGTLSPGLTLGKLRIHWRHGQPGAITPGLYDGADAHAIYAHGASVAEQAAREIQLRPLGRADIALAAADILNAAADATGNRELRNAADGFIRTAQPPRQAPAPTATGQALRTASRLLAATRPPSGTRSGSALIQLITALVTLASAIAEFRNMRNRQRQTNAARSTATQIRSRARLTTRPQSSRTSSLPAATR